MKPIISFSPQLVLSLQQQVVSLLAAEVGLLEAFEFTPDELLSAGWTPDLIERVQAVLAKMKQQVVGTGGEGDNRLTPN